MGIEAAGRGVVVVPWEDLPRTLPDLSFSIGSRSGRADQRGSRPHPLSGVGKLIFGVVLAELGAADPALMQERLSLRSEHRERARTGTLRLLTGDMTVSIDDAANLVLSTGDGASALALLEFFEGREISLESAARRLLIRLGLGGTRVSGMEGSTGEIFLGTTTSEDLRSLLTHLCSSMAQEYDEQQAKISPQAARVVLRWMRSVFEPGGLAGALPGHGPHRVPHWTVAGWESLPQGEEQGCSSVLIAHSDHAGWVSVAAFHPAWETCDSTSSPRGVSAALGTLGLSAYLNKQQERRTQGGSDVG